MSIILIRPGIKFDVCAWGDEEYCELIEFLQSLERETPVENAKIWSRINRTADHGPPHNPQDCHPLQGADAAGLYELKTSGGIRVIWFYD